MSSLAFTSLLPLPLHSNQTVVTVCRPAIRVTLRASVSPTTLEPFAKAIRGEWTGYEGTFHTSTGLATPIPEVYIPEQFLEWNLTPHGFECNHSLIVRSTTLYRKFFRVLPTVSLFADHVDVEEELSTLDLTSPHTTIFPDGDFAFSKDVEPQRTSKLQKWPRIELRLTDPRPDFQKALHVHASFNFEKRQFVNDVRAVMEDYSCIYCDGADLEGSSGYVEGWTSEPIGNAESLTGRWRVQGEEGTEEVTRTAREPEPHRQLYLPKGIDLNIMGDEDLTISVGWLVSPETRVVIQRTFSASADLLSTRRFVETKLH